MQTKEICQNPSERRKPVNVSVITAYTSPSDESSTQKHMFLYRNHRLLVSIYHTVFTNVSLVLFTGKIDNRKKFNKNTYAYVNMQTDSYKTFDENTFVLIDAIHPSIHSAADDR